MSVQVVLDQYLWQGKTTQDFSERFPGDGRNFPYNEFTVYVSFDHTSAAGTVLVETSHSTSGPWATVATIAWAAIDTTKYASVTGVFKYVRCRISSAVTSGTCDCYIIAAIT